MSQFAVLQQKNFLPLFIAQFLGALHDNLFKNAIIVLLIFSGNTEQLASGPMVSIAAALFIFPYIIFSGLAAELGGKFDKSKLIQAIKIAEIMIAFCGVVALFTSSVALSYATLFLLGSHAALFAPSKYSILPEHLPSDQLLSGNALINSATFIAILIGTMLGTSNDST